MINKEENRNFDLTDETLVNLTLLGSNEAFEALVIRYRKAVAASAYQITRDYHLAEDVMQNSFVTAWTKLVTLREPCKFGVWIRNIAKNNAKNIVMKYRDCVNFDYLEEIESENADEIDYDPLYNVIENLSEKLKSVIKLFYFEDATVEEISTKLNLPIGTVKWRMYEGREKIRKELGYMENNSNEIAKTIQMKVREFCIRWRSRFDLFNFEGEYIEMISELEKLPEMKEKYYYMADVMELGWWWIYGKGNTEAAEKVKEVAEKGENKRMIGEVWKLEAYKYNGQEEIEYILNTLIPKMEKANMTEAVGWEWFWLGWRYFKNRCNEMGYEAYNKVLKILPKNDIFYANAISAIRMEKFVENSNIEKDKLWAGAIGEKLFIDNGKLYLYYEPAGYSKIHKRYTVPAVFHYASRCDNIIYDSSLKVGESIKSGDGSVELKFVSDSAEIKTSCGKFTDCELWVTEKPGFKSSVYFKRGVGIVYISIEEAGRSKKCYCSLKRFNIIGGEELIPLCEGNKWEYETEFASDAEIIYEIISSDGSESVLSAYNLGIKFYSPDVWEDMIVEMCNEFYAYENGCWKFNDISFQMERAAALADTKYKKVHTAVATDVMKIILEKEKSICHWTFFQYHTVHFKNGKIELTPLRIFAFEEKNGENTGDMSYHLAVNYFISIINEATDCIWNEDWKPGAKMTVKGKSYFKPVTDIFVEHLDYVEIAAGRFEDCLKVSFDIKGNDGAGWNNFLKGKKEYYYAKGIGLIKGVHHFKDDTVTPVYELTAYEGTGEGYMPVKDGIFRRYEGMGMTNGFVGKAEYTFCEDDNGKLVLLENNTGIKIKQ